MHCERLECCARCMLHARDMPHRSHFPLEHEGHLGSAVECVDGAGSCCGSARHAGGDRGRRNASKYRTCRGLGKPCGCSAGRATGAPVREYLAGGVNIAGVAAAQPSRSRLALAGGASDGCRRDEPPSSSGGACAHIQPASEPQAQRRRSCAQPFTASSADRCVPGAAASLVAQWRAPRLVRQALMRSARAQVRHQAT